MKKIAAALAGVLTLSACSAQPDPEPQPSHSPTNMPTISPQPKETEEAATAFVDPRVPVACDVGRELTELEKSLLVEPGPYPNGGANARFPELLKAIRATNPQTPEEWAIATRWVVQGDYAELVCELLKFEVDLGEIGATPSGGAGAPEVAQQRHFGIALDASGSMAAKSGGRTRMEQAKDAIRKFADGLPEGSTVSLRVYGHEGSNQESGKAVSCNSSEVIFNGSPAEAGFGTALDGIQPVGWTPLGKAIQDTAADIPAAAKDAVIYVVSDGLETCDGDPVASAEKVAEHGVSPIINVIGFEVGADERKALEEVAAAGHGKYVHANNAAALNRYWKEEQGRLKNAWSWWRTREHGRARGIFYRDINPTIWKQVAASSKLTREDIRVSSAWWPTNLLNEDERDAWDAGQKLNNEHYRVAHEYFKSLSPSEAEAAYKDRMDEIDRIYQEAVGEDR